jgi:hypothetical protein
LPRKDAHEINDRDCETSLRVSFVHARDQLVRDGAHLRPFEMKKRQHAGARLFCFCSLHRNLACSMTARRVERTLAKIARRRLE